MSETKVERIPAAERREQILAAASLVFGERGYAGTTTDQVARAAGISQPYVVRLFGSKEKLYVAAFERALGRLLDTFREVIRSVHDSGGDQACMSRELGRAYIDLVEDRGILLMQMQSFLLGNEPVIGEHARKGFMSAFRLLRDEGGFGADQVREFLAYGMLLNTVLAMRLPHQYGTEPAARELLDSIFRDKMQIVLTAIGADS